MKAFFSAFILAISLLGSIAGATTEGTILKSMDGELQFIPVQRHCEDAGEGHCISKSDRCEEGYSRRIKVCWGGWSHGFYRCGTVCSPDERKCEWGDASEYCRWKNGNH